MMISCGYHVVGMDMIKWKNEGYKLCLEGVKAKFHQNPNLLSMLRTTKPKLLAEGSLDKLWGTGVHLRDTNAMDKSR